MGVDRFDHDCRPRLAGATHLSCTILWIVRRSASNQASDAWSVPLLDPVHESEAKVRLSLPARLPASLYGADRARKYINRDEHFRFIAALRRFDKKRSLFGLLLACTGARVPRCLP
jgi:hypothetical protein